MERTSAIRNVSPQRVRREPERGALYEVLRDHLEDFIAHGETNADGRGLPAFVVRELRSYLGCGIPARGFARVRCGDCRQETVVAFSCKGRGFCPSCGGRRMAASAADLVDHVLPDVSYRQWVLSIPHRLRYLLAYDAEACSAVLRAFLRTLFAWQRRRARHAGVREPECGSVTAIQRFGSMLNLNVHFHVLVPDGVFTASGHGATFHPLAPPTSDEIARLVARVGERVRRLLERLGRLPPVDDADDGGLATDDPLLAACYAASVQGRVALGEGAGRRVQRNGLGPGLPWDASAPALCAAEGGFNLHAAVTAAHGDRDGLEHLCRYLCRPPFAADSLSRIADDRVALRLRRPLRDGSTHLFFTPHELIEKLCALIPRPRHHLLRYHGVFAPNAKLRTAVVPGPPAPATSDPERARVRAARHLTWAALMKRVFDFDVLRCPNCGGTMRLVAFIRNPKVAAAILRALDLPDTAPEPRPPRPPPTWD